jgi:hypothetical protein
MFWPKNRYTTCVSAQPLHAPGVLASVFSGNRSVSNTAPPAQPLVSQIDALNE